MSRDELVLSIKTAMGDVAQITSAKLVSELDESTVLLESGLDSLGFAMLVASLEESLGYDPFVISEEAFYPSNLGEFVDFYHKNNPKT